MSKINTYLDIDNVKEVEAHIRSLQGEEKKFICKGKHQYREAREEQETGGGGKIIKSTWVCQCGKTINK